MSNIQKTLDSLQPYVIGIRYLDGVVLVDAVFKEGWAVPDEPNIKKAKGNDEMNYYMIFSDTPEIGLDELLNYVERIIKLNQEREKKHDLLRQKVNELKEVFKKNPLTKLSRLKFSFEDEDLTPKLDDFDVDFDLEEIVQPKIVQPKIAEEPFVEEPFVEEIIDGPKVNGFDYLDEDGNPIVMSELELEMIEEENRAARNLKMTSKKTPSTKIELPPKRKLQMETSGSEYESERESECECGPEEACEKCIDRK